MKYLMKNNSVVSILDDRDRTEKEKNKDCTEITIDRDITWPDGGLGTFADPRTDEEKKFEYKDLRRTDYPSVQDQLDMIYWDFVNGTTTFEDCISVIKKKYPKVI